MLVYFVFWFASHMYRLAKHYLLWTSLNLDDRKLPSNDKQHLEQGESFGGLPEKVYTVYTRKNSQVKY